MKNEINKFERFSAKELFEHGYDAGSESALLVELLDGEISIIVIRQEFSSKFDIILTSAVFDDEEGTVDQAENRLSLENEKQAEAVAFALLVEIEKIIEGFPGPMVSTLARESAESFGFRRSH